MLWLGFSLPSYGELICATANIEIPQQASMERQAFEARMNIKNTLDGMSLDQVSVDLLITDEAGNDVVLAQGAESPDDALFYVSLENRRGLTAVNGSASLQANASADLSWRLIPTPGAAGSLPAGKRYYVGAKLSYLYNGESQSIDVAPDFIRVTPPPQLLLDYFMSETVIGDDPQTSDIIETQQPYDFVARVSNIGMGSASFFTLENPKPVILRNDDGFSMSFDVLKGYLQDQEKSPDLSLNFGTLPGKSIRTARWQMTSPFAGNFLGFSASAKHSAELGGDLTSLFSVNLPHYLVRNVRVQLPGRDNLLDQLAYDIQLDSDERSLRLYESEVTANS